MARFAEDLLFTHRDQLAAAGTLYPADRFDAHFLAALDLMELQWGGLEKQAVGAWDRLAEQVRGWHGTVIVSHEILATATPTQVRRAFASFGDGVEVHVVLSARDLVRQVPDRPGHDRRYAMDGGRLRALGWAPRVPFEEGIARTVRWYADNEPRWRAARDDDFEDYYRRQYAWRLERSVAS